MRNCNYYFKLGIACSLGALSGLLFGMIFNSMLGAAKVPTVKQLALSTSSQVLTSTRSMPVLSRSSNSHLPICWRHSTSEGVITRCHYLLGDAYVSAVDKLKEKLHR